MQQKKYNIEIQYPKSEEEMLALRKQLGTAYLEFVKKYLDTQPLTQEEINFIINRIINNFPPPP